MTPQTGQVPLSESNARYGAIPSETGDKMDKPRMPRTKAQKGKTWATATLVICGAYSIYANVRSGQLAYDNVVTSAFPPIVAFLSSHLISYFNPASKGMKTVIYGGFGLIAVISMYGSGYHIVEFAMHSGQPFQTALAYVFMTDAPMLLAAGILIEKVTTSKTTTVGSKQTVTPKPAQTVPAKAVAAKATNSTVQPKAPAKRQSKATPAKVAKATKAVPAFKEPDISMDTFEKDMLNA